MYNVICASTCGTGDRYNEVKEGTIEFGKRDCDQFVILIHKHTDKYRFILDNYTGHIHIRMKE